MAGHNDDGRGGGETIGGGEMCDVVPGDMEGCHQIKKWYQVRTKMGMRVRHIGKDKKIWACASAITGIIK